MAASPPHNPTFEEEYVAVLQHPASGYLAVVGGGGW